MFSTDFIMRWLANYLFFRPISRAETVSTSATPVSSIDPARAVQQVGASDTATDAPVKSNTVRSRKAPAKRPQSMFMKKKAIKPSAKPSANADEPVRYSAKPGQSTNAAIREAVMNNHPKYGSSAATVSSGHTLNPPTGSGRARRTQDSSKNKHTTSAVGGSRR